MTPHRACPAGDQNGPAPEQHPSRTPAIFSRLLGSNLVEALPQRIGDCEVFVQIITETSARSAWVAREFAWAIDYARPSSRPRRLRVILPIVVRTAVPPPAVASWAYLAMPEGPTSSTLEVLREAAMRAVAVVMVDPANPYRFDRSLREYCADQSLRGLRVVLDPHATVMELVRSTIRYASEMESEHRSQIVTQQRRVFDQLQRLLAVLDAAFPIVVDQIRARAFEHWSPDDRLDECVLAVQRFTQIAFGSVILEQIADWGVAMQMPPETLGSCRTVLAEIAALQSTMPSIVGIGKVLWAVGAGTRQRWVELGFDGKPGVEPARVLLPSDHFDEIGLLSLTSGPDSPASEISTTDWLLIGLPQVAGQRLPREEAEVPEWAEHIGWDLRDYRRSGRV